MKLSGIFTNAPKVNIDELMTDSRCQATNGLFFCIKGMVNDGHNFISQAKDNGAIAIVHSDNIEHYDDELIYIQVENVLSTLNIAASLFYANCTEKMTIFGVTGTNGKTVITSLIKNVLNESVPCGYIGTTGISYGNVAKEAFLTTPNIVPLHQTMYDMYKAKMKAVALEISSIGLELQRCDSIDFDYAVFSNFSNDHLDFHGTTENYFKSKQLLFNMLKKGATAIINADNDYSEEIVDKCEANIVTYGIKKRADYRAKSIIVNSTGTSFLLVHRNKEYPIETNLVAHFNVYNLLATIATLHSYGLDLMVIIDRLHDLPQEHGRMETIDEGQNFKLIVDVAHTAESFEKIYEYALEITPTEKRLIAVFGSPGKRDIKKRRLYGEISDKYCDLIILTEEDPRDENPKSIADEISEGIANTPCVFIESRYDAIRQGIEVANEGDTVLILGKGDENYMQYESGKEMWEGDHIVAREVIRKFYYEQGEYDEEKQIY